MSLSILHLAEQRHGTLIAIPQKSVAILWKSVAIYPECYSTEWQYFFSYCQMVECRMQINNCIIFHGKATLSEILQKSVAILLKSVAIYPECYSTEWQHFLSYCQLVEWGMQIYYCILHSAEQQHNFPRKGNSYCHSAEKHCHFVEKCCHFTQNATLQNGNTFLVIAIRWDQECKSTIAFCILQNSNTIFHGKATLIAILQKGVAILWKSVAILPRMLLYRVAILFQLLPTGGMRNAN